MSYKHPIPINVSEARNLFGITTSRNLLETLILCVLTYLVIKYLLSPFVILVKAVFVVLMVFPIILAFVGLGEKSLFEYITDIFLFKVNKGVFKYRLPVPLKIEEDE